MNGELEKVYVGIGNDLQDGFKTLEWTLRKWSSQPISIVLLHVANDISKEFVYTPFGKLPASSVSDEKVLVLRGFELEKIDKLLSKYINFCGKVKAEVFRIEKTDEPVEKKIVDLISELQITNLVMGFTFLKPSNWKLKNAISESYYVYRNKPDCCQLYLILGGKQVFLRGESHGRIMEDEEGVMVAKFRDKPSFRNMFGSLFTENFRNLRQSSFSSFSSSSSSSSSTSPNSSVSQNPWEVNLRALNDYYDQQMALNLEDENLEQEEEDDDDDDDDGVFVCPNGSDITEHADSIMRAEEKMEVLKTKLEEAGKSIQLKNNEAKANAERLAKAEWAISLCSRRTEELEARIKAEAMNREGLTNELDSVKDHIREISCDIQENQGRLNSLVQLQSELSAKIQIFTLEKSRAEARLENAVTSRTEMVREIEELRRQRDVVNRRIEFCRAKDAVGMTKTTSEGRCSLREYTGEEIRLATSEFSDRLRLKISGDDDGAAWFRARINHSTVAIKLVDSATDASATIHFQAKVEFLSEIRHPSLVALVGICFDPKCIIFDYMHHATLSDMLFDATPKICRDKSQPLRWFDRIRILTEVCSALAFLHEAQPRPIVHGRICPSNIFLDHNLVAKIGTYNLVEPTDDGLDFRSNIQDFGSLVLKTLIGNKWGLIEADQLGGGHDLVRALDDTAGQWPLDLAEALVGLGLRCVGCHSDMKIGKVMEEVKQIRRMADDLVTASGLPTRSVAIDGGVNEDDQSDVPRIFFCPIFQEVMKNPHIAADGFSYELEAIEEWINTRHDTSPMTNLKLDHTFLTPNQTLRSLIQDWHNKMSLPLL